MVVGSCKGCSLRCENRNDQKSQQIIKNVVVARKQLDPVVQRVTWLWSSQISGVMVHGKQKLRLLDSCGLEAHHPPGGSEEPQSHTWASWTTFLKELDPEVNILGSDCQNKSFLHEVTKYVKIKCSQDFLHKVVRAGPRWPSLLVERTVPNPKLNSSQLLT